MADEPKNYWSIQLHPGSRPDMGVDKIKEILEQKQVIGMGEQWYDQSGKLVDDPRLFKEEMEHGDVVMVRDGSKPVALVKVIGDATLEPNVDRQFDWFPLRRKIKVLGFFGLDEKHLQVSILSQYGNKHFQAMGTLNRCANDKATAAFIKSWYKNYLTKEHNMDNKTDELIELLKANKNLILTGAPGTGKTYSAIEIAKKLSANSKNNSHTTKIIDDKYPPLEKSLAWWHEEVFNILYNYHEQHNEFVFSMRVGQTAKEKEKIKKGYWFLGTDKSNCSVKVGLTLRADDNFKAKVLHIRIGLKKIKELDNQYELNGISFVLAFSDTKNSKLIEFRDALLQIFTGENIEGKSVLRIPINFTGSLKDILETSIAKYWDKLNEVLQEYDEENCISQDKFMQFILNRQNVLNMHQGSSIDGNVSEAFRLVQFHPSFDYTDFVEGLRPVKNPDNDKEIIFERQDGIFKEFCKIALGDPDNKYIFIIDEINRGEVNKIFGELFFAIDPGYRGLKGLVDTQYQKLITTSEDEDEDEFAKGFYVPDNVYIIGTMNDIDRSVESFDFALRRRFVWYEITAADSQVMLENNPKLDGVSIPAIKNRMNNLNAQIEAIPGLGTAYQIGAAYFLKLTHYKTDTGVDFEKLWKLHLKPLLSEYLRGFDDINKRIEELESAYNKTDIQ